MSERAGSNKNLRRSHVRFKPDPLDMAYVAISKLDDPFTPELVALIVEEAPMGGCGLVMLKDDRFQPTVECRVQVGRLAPLRSAIAWRQDIDETLMRIGVRFLE